MEDAKIVCRDGSTMSVPVLAERGVWCVHLTPAGPGRGPSCSITHRPSGASIVEVFSRTAALHALSFLNPDYQPAAIGPSDGVRFRMPKGSAPGGLLEMLAYLRFSAEHWRQRFIEHAVLCRVDGQDDNADMLVTWSLQAATELRWLAARAAS